MNSVPNGAVGNWLAELQRLVNQDRSVSLHEHLLRVATRGLGAAGGAVWCVGDDRCLRLESQIGLGSQRIDSVQEEWSGHAELLQAVLETGRPQAVSASLNARPAGNGADRPATQTLQVLAGPVYSADSRPNGVIELFLPGDAQSGSEQAALGALHQFCHRAVVISSATGSTDAQPVAAGFLQFAQACRRIHASLDVEATAVAIANEARVWIGCDRVSVFETQGRKCRLWAISDQDAIDQRSRAVRSLQSLAETVVQRGEAYWSDGDDFSTPESSNPPTDSADSEAPSTTQPDHRVAAVLMSQPDSAGGTCAGVLVAEDFGDSGTWEANRRARTELIAAQGALAINNAVAHRSLPLSSMGRFLERMGWHSPGQSLPRWGVAMALFIAIVAWLALYPADFRITGRGELQPATQRDVFASVRGVVDTIQVRHGDTVQLDEPLVTLRSPELERERTRLEGQLRTTEQQVADLATLRAGSSRDFSSRPENSAQLAAREQELTAVLQSVQDQLAALEQYEAELTLTSPLTGQVLTWNVEELLEGRPVEAGQRLLTVADVNGPWVLRIRVPDHDIRHAIDARAAGPLQVSFVMATDVETQYHGTVTDVARIVDYDPLEGPVVVVTAEVERTEGLDLRPGATVYPYIECGRRSIGYVWFRRLIDSTKSWLAL